MKCFIYIYIYREREREIKFYKRVMLEIQTFLQKNLQTIAMVSGY